MATVSNAHHQDNNPNTAAAAAPVTSTKQTVPPAKTVDTQSVLKRLQSELMALMMSGDAGISAFPEEDNIFCWKGTNTGSKDTVFEGTEYKLSLSFPSDYPYKPPKVKFETGCFHPNVDVYGNICLDTLQDKWSSAYDVRTILLSIQSLLGEPNISSPLNTPRQHHYGATKKSIGRWWRNYTSQLHDDLVVLFPMALFSFLLLFFFPFEICMGEDWLTLIVF